MLVWTSFNPLCHTLSHISGPPKVRHTSRNPPIFSNTCIHTYIFTGRFVLVRGGSCLGALSGGSLSGGLCSGWFLSVPLLSEYIRYNRKLNITFNFRFHMYEKI